MNQIQSREAAINHINALHDEAVSDFQGTIRNAMHEAALRHREIGIKLHNLKNDTKHGEWLKLFASHRGQANTASTLHFDATTAQRYMRVASLFPGEPSRVELEDNWCAIKAIWGNLAELEDIATGQDIASKEPWYTRVGNSFSNIAAAIQKKVDQRPIEQWELPECRQTLEGMETVGRYKARLEERVQQLQGN